MDERPSSMRWDTKSDKRITGKVPTPNPKASTRSYAVGWPSTVLLLLPTVIRPCGTVRSGRGRLAYRRASGGPACCSVTAAVSEPVG